MAAVHLCAGLEYDKLESRAEVVQRGRGAAEHVHGIVEFSLDVFVGLVCWYRSAHARWQQSARAPLLSHTKIVDMGHLFNTSDLGPYGVFQIVLRAGQ